MTVTHAHASRHRLDGCFALPFMVVAQSSLDWPAQKAGLCFEIDTSLLVAHAVGKFSVKTSAAAGIN
jgi:hypothetical protein